MNDRIAKQSLHLTLLDYNDWYATITQPMIKAEISVWVKTVSIEKSEVKSKELQAVIPAFSLLPGLNITDP